MKNGKSSTTKPRRSPSPRKNVKAYVAGDFWNNFALATCGPNYRVNPLLLNRVYRLVAMDDGLANFSASPMDTPEFAARMRAHLQAQKTGIERSLFQIPFQHWRHSGRADHFRELAAVMDSLAKPLHDPVRRFLLEWFFEMEHPQGDAYHLGISNTLPQPIQKRRLTKQEIADLLHREGFGTHDPRWIQTVCDELGIEWTKGKQGGPGKPRLKKRD